MKQLKKEETSLQTDEELIEESVREYKEGKSIRVR